MQLHGNGSKEKPVILDPPKKPIYSDIPVQYKSDRFLQPAKNSTFVSAFRKSDFGQQPQMAFGQTSFSRLNNSNSQANLNASSHSAATSSQ
jgi:hypothetical protein